MSIGPMSFAASLAAVPLNKASEAERALQDSAAQQRQAETNRKAENAAGVGTTDGEDNAAGDRDADGHRLWEKPPQKGQTGQAADESEARVKDPSGESGSLLDLSG